MDKEALTRGGAGPVGLPQDDVEIPDVATVRVRALNRGELLHGGRLNDNGGQQAMERYVLACAIIAINGEEGKLTEADVEDWQTSAVAMECQSVLQRINELSGIAKESPKSDVPGDGGKPVD